MRVSRVGRVITIAAVSLGCMVFGVAQASTASAHAEIVTSTPAEGTNLGAAPSTITLVMSEAVELRYTKITITDGQGRQTPLSGLRIGEPPAGSEPAAADSAVGATTEPAAGAEAESPVAITATLPALPPDVYRVAWSTVSSDDLHATSGVVVFGVQTPVTTRPAQPADPLPGAGEVALRWTALIGLGSAAGGVLLWLLLLRGRRAGPEPLRALALPLVGRRLLFVGAVGAGVAALADAARLLLQAHAAGGGWLEPAAHLLAGGYGLRWAGREVAAVGILLICRGALRRSSRGAVARPVRTASGVVGLSALYSLAVTLTGHAGAGAAHHPFRVAVETAHVTAAITWVGALAVAAVVLWRPVPGPDPRTYLGRPALAMLRRSVLSRFGLVAAACVAVMTTTGLLLAGSGVASADALLTSTYGRLLLLKVTLVGISLSAAAATALAVHPDLVPRRALGLVSSLRLRVVLGIEAAAAVAVLLAAAALGSAQPAVGPTWAAAPVVQPLVSGSAGDLVETVQVAPNRPGRNFVTVDVFDSRRPMLAPIGSVLVALTGPDGSTTSTVATAQGDGRWLVPTDVMTSAGRWTVDLSVSRPGLPVSVQRYRWVVADPNAVTRRTVVSDRPIAPVLRWAAGGVAGFAVLVGGLLLWRQTRGNRSRTSAPPSGASPTQTSPLNVADTADTRAKPSPVPGSSPAGWR